MQFIYAKISYFKSYKLCIIFFVCIIVCIIYLCKYFSVSDKGGSLSQYIHEDSGYGSPANVNFGI